MSVFTWQVSTKQMHKDGCLFPSFDSIRDVSLEIAVAVARGIVKTGRASESVSSYHGCSDDATGSCDGDNDDDVLLVKLRKVCKEVMYEPE